MLGANEYINNSIEDEVIVFVGGSTGLKQWVVAEFRPSFDPNIANTEFSGSNLEINLYGYETSNVKLKGTSTGITEEYSVSGKKSTIVKQHPDQNKANNGAKQFVASGKKIVNAVKDLDASKLAKGYTDFVNKVDPLSNYSGDAPLIATKFKIFNGVSDRTIEATKRIVNEGKLKNVLGTVFGAVKDASGVLGLLDNVVGMLWPSKKNNKPTKPPFTPTITKTTLEIEGTIETSHALATIQLQVPGSDHITNGNLPYYDCPMGLFNIMDKPVLEQIDYQRYVGYSFLEVDDPNYGGHDTEVRKGYSSYRVRDEIIGKYNAGAGVELVSAQVAIVGELPINVFNGESYFSSTQNSQERSIENYINPLLVEFEAGRLVMANERPVYASTSSTGDGSTSTAVQEVDRIAIFQTPYVDFGCFKGLAFNVPTETKVYVRVKAILKRAGESDADAVPIFYIKDYAVNKEAGTNPTNPDYAQADSFDALPPYHNNATPFTGAVINYVGSYPTNGTLSHSDVVVTSGTFTDPGVNLEASKSLTVDGQITIAHPTNEVIFRAGQIVKLKPGFQVSNGSKFKATTDYNFQLSCQTSQLEPLFSSCGYNSNAFRLGNTNPIVEEELEDEPIVDGELLLYPNPTQGMLQVQLYLGKETDATLNVYDLTGALKEQMQFERITSINQQLNLQGLPRGMYIIKVTTAEQSYSSKVIVK